MKKVLLGLAALAILAASCQKDSQVQPGDRSVVAGGTALAFTDTVTLSGVLSTTRTLVATTLYRLDGKYFIKSGGRLVIPAGTRIEGVKKTNTKLASALVVTKGGKIEATGTPTSPVVFTSAATAKLPGDWGGVVILGKARINQSNNPIIEGIDQPSLPAGVDVTYGTFGSDANNADNSGIFRYVRIEYAGAQIATDNELNGLTLGGVGSGTELHHVEVAYGADDAFEFFGGRVHAKYLVALAPNDDAFDFDFGYQGNLQYLLAVLKTGYTFSANPNGIESDNDGTGSAAAPRTLPTISNLTIIGLQPNNASLLNGNHWRRNSDLLVRNSVVLGYPTGIKFESTGTIASAPKFTYNLVHAYTAVASGAALPATNQSYLNATNANASIKLNNIVSGATFNPSPATGSPAATGANFTGLPIGAVTPNNQFFQSTTFRGAFALNNRTWLNGWTTF